MRPNHLGPQISPGLANRRAIAAVAGVGLIHLAFVYGLMSGLAGRVVESLPAILDVQIIEPSARQPVELPPPAPLPDTADFVKPQLEFVPPPQIEIAAPPPPRAITAIPKAIDPVPVSRPAAALGMAASPPAPVPPRSIAATHTIPPYPPLSRRLGEEGLVGLRLVIGTDGRVQVAHIEQSSGSERLDKAAREWVEQHWRYRPASRDGRPVASEVQVNVVFNLKSAR